MSSLSVMSERPKVLYLPNEAIFQPEGFQVGGRAAFAEMAAEDLIAELKVYSFLANYYATGKKREAAHRSLLEEVRAFQPDILFWQHPDNYPLNDDLLREVRRSTGLLVYHEADPFDRLYKRIRSPQRLLYRYSDVFFTVGLSEGRRLFEEIMPHPHLYYCPSCVDRERFDRPRTGRLGTRYDAVMIGSIARLHHIIPQPDSDKRVALARGLARLFGDRFASFGNGWPSGTNCNGPIPYATQTAVIQQSKMSLMWELYPKYSYYFSDRLPIALAAGAPFITSTHTGYEKLFINVPGMFHAASVEAAIDAAVYLRSLPLEQIEEMGEGNRRWMLENLEARVVFRKAFDTCLRVWHSGQSRAASK